MSGAIKHVERSHKTGNKNYSEFRQFNNKAVPRKDGISFAEQLKAMLHKNQSK